MGKANIYDDLREDLDKKRTKSKKEKKIKEEIKKEAEKEVLKNTDVDPETKEFKKLAEKAKKRREKKLEKESKSPMQTIKQMSVKQKRKAIIVGIIIAYACFLLFGLFSSDFVQNESGIAIPVAKSQQEVKRTEEYKAVKSFYDSAQSKYKEVLDTDIEIANNEATAKLSATRYAGYLSWYDAYLTQLKGLEVSEEFLFIKENLVSWAANDICVYLQNISDAFSENNSEKATIALTQDRYRTINDFNIITSDLANIGMTIEGVSLEGLDFNPEKYGLGGESE